MADAPRLVLASGSAARKSLLEAAGLTFEISPAEVDEVALREALLKKNANIGAEDIARQLAREKARVVSERLPGAFVIGADQVLALENTLFSKAATILEARKILLTLRGTTHELVSAVALARGGRVRWEASDKARMTMRNFSEAFLDSYLEQMGERAKRSVGCYELESLGIQLFANIAGDYFTILGIPLLPLLERLRQEEMIAA